MVRCILSKIIQFCNLISDKCSSRKVRWPGAPVPRRGPGLCSHDEQARIAFLPLPPTAQSLFLRGRIVL